MTARSAFVDQLVTVTLDRARGLALVAGRANAQRAAFLLTRPDDGPRWSSTGRGWVVSYGTGVDVTAWAQLHRVPCRVVQLDDGGPA